MQDQNLIPFGSKEEVDKMFAAIELAKDVLETGHSDEVTAKLIAQCLADVEVRAGDLYESFRDRLDEAARIETGEAM